MAQATTFRFGAMVITLGDGATPTEVFSAPCGLTEKAFNLSAETVSTNVPDCDNPDGATWTETDVRSRTATINGSGVLARESQKVWRDFFLQDTSKNIKVLFPGNLAQGGGTWTGKGRLTSLEMGAAIGERVNVSINIEGDGAWTFTPAAA